MTEIMTPKTHPDHDVIGRRFRAWDVYADRACVFICDSYDPRIGYWMTREDAPEEHKSDEEGPWRRNVTERAIGRTFHRIWD
jgi:hypothetical protein